VRAPEAYQRWPLAATAKAARGSLPAMLLTMLLIAGPLVEGDVGRAHRLGKARVDVLIAHDEVNGLRPR